MNLPQAIRRENLNLFGRNLVAKLKVRSERKKNQSHTRKYRSKSVTLKVSLVEFKSSISIPHPSNKKTNVDYFLTIHGADYQRIYFWRFGRGNTKTLRRIVDMTWNGSKGRFSLRCSLESVKKKTRCGFIQWTASHVSWPSLSLYLAPLNPFEHTLHRNLNPTNRFHTRKKVHFLSSVFFLSSRQVNFEWQLSSSWHWVAGYFPCPLRCLCRSCLE